MSAEPHGEHSASGNRDAPATRLYRHALESIFAFCTLKELHALLAVSRDWSSAVVSMPPIRAWQRMETIETLTAVASSRLACHVTDVFEQYPCTAEGLRIMAERMPWIEKRFVPWSIVQPDCAKAALAASNLRQLKVLSVSLQAPDAGLTIEKMDSQTVVANHWIHAAACLPLLEEFWLILWCHDERILFAPLTALPRLHTLSATAAQLLAPVPSNEQIAALRQMHSLESFQHNFSDRKGTLRLLLQDPTPPLRWTKAFAESGDADLVLLQRLPALTALDVECRCGDVDFLLSLPPRVATLCLQPCGDPVGPVDLTRIVTTLQRCPQITSLLLHGLGFTSAQLATLLPMLPRLSALTLLSLSELTSLSFLASEALSRSLTALEVVACPNVSSGEVAHLLGLRSLKTLSIYCLQEPLSDEQRAQIRTVHPRAGL